MEPERRRPDSRQCLSNVTRKPLDLRVLFAYLACMSGAPAHARVRQDPDDLDAEPTPTLATAPEGLSARRVERWLDLPPGAWQRRRLYALRITGQAFVSIGFRQGDLVIVEPGAREQPASVVVTRSMSGCSLKRIPSLVPVEHRTEAVLELPLRERRSSSQAAHVTGTVIGLLRPTGTGALRAVSLGWGKPRVKRRIGSSRPMPPANEIDARVPASMLTRTLIEWRAWLSTVRSVGNVAPVNMERWNRLGATLATLMNCLDHAHSPALRSALSGEAVAVATDLRNVMGR